MRRIKLRCSYSTRPISAKSFGEQEPKKGVKKLSDKGKDRVRKVKK